MGTVFLLIVGLLLQYAAVASGVDCPVNFQLDCDDFKNDQDLYQACKVPELLNNADQGKIVCEDSDKRLYYKNREDKYVVARGIYCRRDTRLWWEGQYYGVGQILNASKVFCSSKVLDLTDCALCDNLPSYCNAMTPNCYDAIRGADNNACSSYTCLHGTLKINGHLATATNVTCKPKTGLSFKEWETENGTQVNDVSCVENFCSMCDVPPISTCTDCISTASVNTKIENNCKISDKCPEFTSLVINGGKAADGISCNHDEKWVTKDGLLVNEAACVKRFTCKDIAPNMTECTGGLLDKVARDIECKEPPSPQVDGESISCPTGKNLFITDEHQINEWIDTTKIQHKIYCNAGGWTSNPPFHAKEIKIICATRSPNEAFDCMKYYPVDGCASADEGCKDVKWNKENSEASCESNYKLKVKNITTEWADALNFTCDTIEGKWKAGNLELLRTTGISVACIDESARTTPVTVTPPPSTPSPVKICDKCNASLPAFLECKGCSKSYKLTESEDKKTCSMATTSSGRIVINSNQEVDYIQCNSGDFKWKTPNGTDVSSFSARLHDGKNPKVAAASSDSTVIILMVAILVVIFIAVIGVVIMKRIRNKKKGKEGGRGVTRPYSKVQRRGASKESSTSKQEQDGSPNK